jgi:hypothetical protein
VTTRPNAHSLPIERFNTVIDSTAAALAAAALSFASTINGYRRNR